jgi:hypothetical protein
LIGYAGEVGCGNDIGARTGEGTGTYLQPSDGLCAARELDDELFSILKDEP